MRYADGAQLGVLLVLGVIRTFGPNARNQLPRLPVEERRRGTRVVFRRLGAIHGVSGV